MVKWIPILGFLDSIIRVGHIEFYIELYHYACLGVMIYFMFFF